MNVRNAGDDLLELGTVSRHKDKSTNRFTGFKSLNTCGMAFTILV